MPVVNQNSGVKAGTVSHFASTTAPNGWIKANGALISRTAYATLFAVIGTTFGAGDGSTTFALPDLRGEFLRSLDDGRGVDAGRVIGGFQNHDFANHNHSGNFNNDMGGSYNYCQKGFAGEVSMIRGWTNGTQTSNVPAQGGTETRPRNIALMACIKY